LTQVLDLTKKDISVSYQRKGISFSFDRVDSRFRMDLC